MNGISRVKGVRHIPVHEAFDDEVAVLDVDLHIMPQDHDGPNAALDIRRLTAQQLEQLRRSKAEKRR